MNYIIQVGSFRILLANDCKEYSFNDSFMCVFCTCNLPIEFIHCYIILIYIDIDWCVKARSNDFRHRMFTATC